ncbi:MAG: hydroxymethylglutaryl-CoA reductase, degradative [Nitrososphaeraceae archaeon]
MTIKKQNFKKIKFYELNHTKRIEYIQKETKLNENDLNILFDLPKNLSFNDVNNMIENVIGIIPVPMGIATNFLINNKPYLIPMAIEESSVIAAASKAAKIAKEKGGFYVQADESIMIGQIQLVSSSRSYKSFFDQKDKKIIKKIIQDNKKELIKIANMKSNSVIAKDIQIREMKDESKNKMGDMIIIELIIDTKDAMGANVINSMCEAISTNIEVLTNKEVILKILSNYSTRRLVRCKAKFSRNQIGDKNVTRFLYAYALAFSDTYRAVTHNKGLMNGIDAVALATGQDIRAIEAAVHAYASRDGKYRSLTKWYESKEGDLVGEIEIPLAVGIVGGITAVNPYVKTALKILKINKSKELAMIMAAVGLAQNFAAIRALVDEGIQKGHMRLHAKNIATAAGAKGDQIIQISKILIEEGDISVSKAKQIIENLKNTKNK